jgi:DMSO/TMAO reductase YedYZ molybdopterin-dependent catalytic subunit
VPGAILRSAQGVAGGGHRPWPDHGGPCGLADRIDVRDTGRERLPPGQIITRKWPVLHYGTVPRVDLAAWRFEVRGAVERPVSLTWD